jgi:hypothetical protein
MPNATDKYFENKDPIVRDLYNLIISQLTKSNIKYELEFKGTSIHIVAKSAFLGVHFMKSALVLNIVLDHAIDSSRMHKVEQISKNRFHNEVRLSSLDQVDEELISWIKEANTLRS